MYLTVCPPCGPGHDSSVGELCISLSVLPVARVMIAQWENECISLSVLFVVRGQFPAMAKYFKGYFPVDHTLPTPSGPAWQKMAQSPLNGTTQLADSEEEGRSPTMDWQTMTEVNKKMIERPDDTDTESLTPLTPLTPLQNMINHVSLSAVCVVKVVP